MTTLEPRKPYTDDELKALYPAGLQLQLVEILMRHGERTPVSARFQNAGLQPFWPYCSAMRQMKSAVLEDAPTGGKAFTTLEWKRRLEAFGPNDAPVVATGPGGELDDVCDMGMLTDRGRETTYELGRRLRTLYVDQLKFLPSTIASADIFYLRATPIPRALESLQQSFAGLYPATTRLGNVEGPFPPPTILTRAPGDETLFPNDSNCRRFAVLSRAFAQRTAERWNKTDEMAYLNKLYGKWMPDGGSPGVAVDSRPRLSGIMDTINSTLAHGPETRLPKEFYDKKGRDIIEKIGVEEWFSGYKESREYRMLGIGGLLGDITARMVGSAEKSTADGEYELMRKTGDDQGQIKFGMSGCHDTTLAATLASLGAFNTDFWPPYTSHIAIELFRKPNETGTVQDVGPLKTPAVTVPKPSWFASFFSSKATPAGMPPPGIGRRPSDELTPSENQKLDGYYVRLRYNDSVVSIPGCKNLGNHLEGDESFCTLSAFKSIVDKFTPQNWKQQCRVTTNVPSFPAKPEPAGY